MKRRHVATGAVALTTAIAMAGAGASMAHAAGNGSDTVRLTNSGRASLAQSTNLRTVGTAATSDSMSLMLQVPLRNEALRQRMLAKGSVISPAEYAKLFGASSSSLKKVSNWAKQQGMSVTSTDAASGIVAVRAPVRTVNESFSLKMQRVALGARTGLAPSVSPQVPRSLGISGVIGLSTVGVKHTGPTKIARQQAQGRSNGHTRSLPMTGKRDSRATAAPAAFGCVDYWGQALSVTAKKWSDMSNYQCGMTPKSLVKTYDASSAAKVKANIGILLWGNDKAAVAKANFLAGQTGSPKLTTYVDRSVPEGNLSNCGGAEEAHSEQALDVQSSHAIAPSASIYYYGAKDCSDASLLSTFQKAVNEHKVSTISMSWGGIETGQSAAFIKQWERTAGTAALTGISLFASTGDMGDESIKSGTIKPSQAKAVQYPASSQYFTAVGGTAVALTQAGGRKFTAGWANTLWDQPNQATTKGITQEPFPGNSVGAGGGVSKLFAQQPWQKGVVKGSTSKRALPDVSALADVATGIAFSPDGKYLYNGGGTSLASPIVGALVASSKTMNHKAIGNAAPYFYKLRGKGSILDVAGPANAKGAVLQPDSGNGYELEGIASTPDSLRTGSGWDNITGVGEPSKGFLSAFGR